MGHIELEGRDRTLLGGAISSVSFIETNLIMSFICKPDAKPHYANKTHVTDGWSDSDTKGSMRVEI